MQGRHFNSWGEGQNDFPPTNDETSQKSPSTKLLNVLSVYFLINIFFFHDSLEASCLCRSLSPLYWSLFTLFTDYADCHLNECYCHQWSCARWAEFPVFVYVYRCPEDGCPVVLHGQLAAVCSTAPNCAEISSGLITVCFPYVDACLSLCLFKIPVPCRCVTCVELTFQQEKSMMTV